MEVRSKLEEELIHLIDPILEDLGLERLHLQILLRRSGCVIQLTIDNEHRHISVADCEQVNRRLNALLDAQPSPLNNAALEVSSPGFKRVLRVPKDLHRFISHRVRIRLREEISGRKVWIGNLQTDGHELVVEKTEIGEVHIPFELIEQANLDD